MKRRNAVLKITSAAVIAASLMCSYAFRAVAAENLPSSYSSAALGYVTEIKSQGYLDCWAYASLATFESKILKSGYETESMSVDHLNLWAVTRSNEKGWIRKVTDDGYSAIALGYLTSWQGGVTQSDAGEIDLSGTGDTAQTNLAKFGVTEIEYLSKDDPEEIKRAIMENGGVYTSYANNNSFFNSTMTSYYMPADYNGSYSGHAVEIVGWDDSYPAESFVNTPDSDGAWLVKNSWGTDEEKGYNGYFWMSYEDKYVFHDKYRPSYAIKTIIPIDDSVKLLQNEIYGATYEFGYIESDELTFVNRFELDDDFSVIDKVVFKTDCKGADYSIYYIPDKDGAPTSDASEWTQLYSGTAEFAGYICADVKDFEPNEKSGSIAVKIDAKNIDATASIGVGEWLVNSKQKFVFINESQKGDSYLYHDGKMQDLLDWYQENDDDLGGTFVIKAITAKKPLMGDANLDGTVDITDATAVQKHVAKMTELSTDARKVADMNGDGTIDITDATAIQKVVAGLRF